MCWGKAKSMARERKARGGSGADCGPLPSFSKLDIRDLGRNLGNCPIPMSNRLKWQSCDSTSSIYRPYPKKLLLMSQYLGLLSVECPSWKKKISQSRVFQKSVWDHFLKYFNKDKQQAMMKSWGKRKWNLIVRLLGCHEFSLPPGHVQSQLQPKKTARRTGRDGQRAGSGLWLPLLGQLCLFQQPVFSNCQWFHWCWLLGDDSTLVGLFPSNVLPLNPFHFAELLVITLGN